MIEEQYVSFKTAKLLTEKGFGGNCLSMYLTPKPNCGMGNPNEAKLAPHGRDSHYYEGYLYQCEAPTQQMAMRWLREVYHLAINIDYMVESPTFKYYIYNMEGTDKYTNFKHYDSYEEACEVAIQYCLKNLI